MKETLLQWLRCPACKCELDLRPEQWSGAEIVSGTLRCRGCATVYPILRSIPRFVPADHYVGNFSLQWNWFANALVDRGADARSSATFTEKSGFRPEEMKERLVLDVGVGNGRYAEIVERAGGTVVGIDLSFSVEAAFASFGTRKGMHLVQADVFSLPFADGVFDYIYSIGVLHHTPDCRGAFLRLPVLLKPGGKVAIWVYAAARSQIEDRMNRFWRRLAGLLPARGLFVACAAASIVSYVNMIPLVKPAMKYLLPRLLYDMLPEINRSRRFRERWLKTFDWYAPRYQSRHTFPEVFAWFEEAGLSDIRIFPTAVAAQGTRAMR